MKHGISVSFNIQKKHIWFLTGLIVLLAAVGFAYAISTDPAVFGHPDNGPIHIVGENVGIGTARPGELLEVNGGAIRTAIGSGAASTDGGRIYFGTNQYSSNYPSVYNQAFISAYTDFAGNDGSGEGTKGGLIFATKATTGANSASERMRINLNGNVGIGTTSPATDFQVLGNIAQIRQANTAEAKAELENMPLKTTMMPRNLGNKLYFYWKSSDGKMYTSIITGTEIP